MVPGRLLCLAVAVLALMVSMTPPAAEAAARTWVSGSNGNDSNPCTRAMPCATFITAYSQTDAFGEINCIDQGNFGVLTITKSITISCDEATAGVLFQFNVFAGASDVVRLRGIDFNGLGTSDNTENGIHFYGAGTLHVERCLIHGFNTGFGIKFEPVGSAALFVEDTLISDNGGASGGGNIQVAPSTGASLVNVVLNNTRLKGGGAGLQVSNNASTTIHADIEDSLASGGAGDGFQATTAGGRLTMIIAHSVASNNALVGVEADGSNTELHIANSRVFGNGTGIVGAAGATLRSYGNNEINLNGHNGTPLSQTTSD